jgi:hypothetical protein
MDDIVPMRDGESHAIGNQQSVRTAMGQVDVLPPLSVLSCCYAELLFLPGTTRATRSTKCDEHNCRTLLDRLPHMGSATSECHEHDDDVPAPDRSHVYISVRAALALIPLALAANQPGSEMQAPMAIVILGGLPGSTALNMIVIPALFTTYGSRTH